MMNSKAQVHDMLWLLYIVAFSYSLWLLSYYN